MDKPHKWLVFLLLELLMVILLAMSRTSQHGCSQISRRSHHEKNTRAPFSRSRALARGCTICQGPDIEFHCKDTPKPPFTAGTVDDVTHLSLPVGDWLNVLPKGTTGCMFHGLGSNGTVGANKNVVKIIAMGTELYAQAKLYTMDATRIAVKGLRPTDPGYYSSSLWVADPVKQKGYNTPMVMQYSKLNKVAFFKVGKLNEIFYYDAFIAQRVSGLKWMSQDKLLDSCGLMKPHLGLPEMAKHEYAKQILEAGFKVVVVEQVERVVETNQRKSEGNTGSGPICVERAPCEVFTCGTFVGPELLQGSLSERLLLPVASWSPLTSATQGTQGSGSGGARMILDATALGRYEGSLLSFLDHTSTPMGYRLLRQRLCAPFWLGGMGPMNTGIMTSVYHRKCIAGSLHGIERAASRIWSFALQAEGNAVMREDVTARCLGHSFELMQAGLRKRIMIMQSVFFKLSVTPDKVVPMNIDGVDASVSGITECPVPANWADLTLAGEAADSAEELAPTLLVWACTATRFVAAATSAASNLPSEVPT